MMVSGRITYPTHDPAAAFAVICDRVFREEVCRATGAIQHSVSVDERADQSVTVTVSRVMAANLPEPVKRMVGETVRIMHTEEWGPPDSSGRTADLLVQIVGQRASMEGTIELRSVDRSVVEAINGDVRVSVPFVGKRIEAGFADAIRAAIDAEQTAVARRFAG